MRIGIEHQGLHCYSCLLRLVGFGVGTSVSVHAFTFNPVRFIVDTYIACNLVLIQSMQCSTERYVKRVWLGLVYNKHRQP